LIADRCRRPLESGAERSRCSSGERRRVRSRKAAGPNRTESIASHARPTAISCRIAIPAGLMRNQSSVQSPKTIAGCPSRTPDDTRPRPRTRSFRAGGKQGTSAMGTSVSRHRRVVNSADRDEVNGARRPRGSLRRRKAAAVGDRRDTVSIANDAACCRSPVDSSRRPLEELSEAPESLAVATFRTVSTSDVGGSRASVPTTGPRSCGAPPQSRPDCVRHPSKRDPTAGPHARTRRRPGRSAPLLDCNVCRSMTGVSRTRIAGDGPDPWQECRVASAAAPTAAEFREDRWRALRPYGPLR